MAAMSRPHHSVIIWDPSLRSLRTSTNSIQSAVCCQSPGLISHPHDLLTILVDEKFRARSTKRLPGGCARKSAQMVPNTVRPVHSEDVKVESEGK